MSQFHNNNFLHNIRVGVRMIQQGMHPDVASLALAKEDINAPSQLLAAAAQPGVLESMGSKPYTHARADQQINAHNSMKANLAKIQAQPEMEEDISFVIVDDDDNF
jgi:hypothetical protein